MPPTEPQIQRAKDEVADCIASGAMQLSLRNMGLEDVEPVALQERTHMLAHVQHCDLSHNPLGMVASHFFGAVPCLLSLRLSGCQIKYLGDGIATLRGLKTLHLRNNLLQELPAGLYSLEQLEELDVTGNGIVSFHEDLGNLVELRSLLAANNRLLCLPAEAENLINLKRVDLTGNPCCSTDGKGLPDKIQRLQARNEILCSKEKRQQLVRRALRVRCHVKNAYLQEILGENKSRQLPCAM
jgi:hypothetical protein